MIDVDKFMQEHAEEIGILVKCAVNDANKAVCEAIRSGEVKINDVYSIMNHVLTGALAGVAWAIIIVVAHMINSAETQDERG